jgi:APA family basic amino acid/polyamine antiporter
VPRLLLKQQDAVLLVVGSMVGSGVFLVSADIARTLGSAGWLLVAWLIAGLVAVAGASCQGRLAALMPRMGGPYVYLRESLHPLAGFLYGWTLFSAIQTTAIAALAVGCGAFATALAPGLAEVAIRPGGRLIDGPRLVAVSAILLLTWVNARGLAGGLRVQRVLTLAKVGGLLLLILLLLALGWRTRAAGANLAACWTASRSHPGVEGAVTIQALSGLPLLAALGAALGSALFCSELWCSLTLVAGEVERPRRNLPRALLQGTAAAALLFLLINAAYLVALPLTGFESGADTASRGIQFAAGDQVAAAAATAALGPWTAPFIAALALLAALGACNGLILAGARVPCAMARDGLFPRRAARLNGHGVPGAALWLQAGWACVLCLSGSYRGLLHYMVFALLAFHLLCAVGLLVLRRSRLARQPRSAETGAALPLAYILATGAIALDLLVMQPRQIWPGLLLTLAGLPAYFLWKRARSGH